jgi:hypothetical protein
VRRTRPGRPAGEKVNATFSAAPVPLALPLDRAALQPLIAQVLEEVVAHLNAARESLPDRLAFTDASLQNLYVPDLPAGKTLDCR